MKNVALITGASSGIGRELAIIHAKKGRDLVITARREDKLEELKAELESTYNVEVKVIVKDISLANSPEEIYEEIKQDNIEVEYLINNAGFGGVGYFDERDLNSDISMIQVNVIALTSLTKLFLRDFKSNNRGKILNISSTASLMPGPMQSVYFATKSYVTSFSNAIYQEVKGTNVTVTALLPGPTETEFGKVSKMDNTSLFDKTHSAQKVALDGYEAMEKGKLNKITGVSFFQRILFALIRVAPRKIVLKMVFNMQQLRK